MPDHLDAVLVIRRRSVSVRRGRASKGGSPWIRPSVRDFFPSRPAVAWLLLVAALLLALVVACGRGRRLAAAASPSRSAWRATATIVDEPRRRPLSSCDGPASNLVRSRSARTSTSRPSSRAMGPGWCSCARMDRSPSRRCSPCSGQRRRLRCPSPDAADRKPRLVRLVARRHPHRVHGAPGSCPWSTSPAATLDRLPGAGTTCIFRRGCHRMATRLVFRVESRQSWDLTPSRRTDRPSDGAIDRRRPTTSTTTSRSAVSPDGAHDHVHALVLDAAVLACSRWMSTRGRRWRCRPRPARVRGRPCFRPTGELVAYATARSVEGRDEHRRRRRRRLGPRAAPIGPKRPAHWRQVASDASWAFAPDGTALLVRYGNDEDGSTPPAPLDGSPATSLGQVASNSSTSSGSRRSDRGCGRPSPRPAALRPPPAGPRAIQSGHGPPSHPDPRRRHRSGAGGGDAPRARRDRHRLRMGGRRRRRGRHGRARDAAPGARPRVDQAQQGRAQGPDHDPGRGRVPQRQRDAPPGARPVRQPPARPLR